ncbi:spore coat protein YutH [Bacillus sp. DNRA2]|uniref:spore coat putative kinase YutH n=1 Tax=Bacillus sp. DNRA2 TaxID=2723053 RepID=UPI00145CE6B5|nr:spore coat protein YutH [Bacillus sp. DNRA2]NMD69015.1 spore coat protein YutH [Bacillus sp. DNRA2]
MIQEWLDQHYGIKAEEEISIGRYSGCKRGDQLYFLIHPIKLEQEAINELSAISAHLVQAGDRAVPVFYRAKNGEILSRWKDENACVLALNQGMKRKAMAQLGRKLAKFHQRGRTLTVPINKLNRLGQWKEIWVKRLEQMEKVWLTKINQLPENEFERMFLESFPYYLGLTENAIQYLVDTELDVTPTNIDHGTVTHERFSEMTWGGERLFKNPFEWILDHGARDIAEWTRQRYFHNSQTYQPDLRQFFSDYQSMTQLSPFSWRLLYARLVFPLHYFDCVEEYYVSSSEQTKHTLEDRLQKIINHSSEYEKFLASFYGLLEVPLRTMKIPEIGWLKGV